MPLSRRELMLASAAALSAGPAVSRTPDFGARPDADPRALARDEAYGSRVAPHYDSPAEPLNLEHGYWGKMALPVQQHYLETTQRVNLELSVYARRQFAADQQSVEALIASALGVAPEEIALTRNATESLQNLVRQYRGLKAGAAALYADADYPEFKSLMQWLKDGAGVRVVRLDLPAQADAAELLARYTAAMESNPDLKLMLLTHTSNQHCFNCSCMNQHSTFSAGQQHAGEHHHQPAGGLGHDHLTLKPDRHIVVRIAGAGAVAGPAVGGYDRERDVRPAPRRRARR